MWCLSHPITWCLLRIRHVTAGGSVSFDPEMAIDPRVCSFIWQIWQEGRDLEPEASATELGLLKQRLLQKLFPSIAIHWTYCGHKIRPKYIYQYEDAGSSVHDSLVFQRFHVNLSSQLQRRRHFDLPCIRCVYDCAGPMEKTQARCSSCPCDSPPPSCY